MPDVMNSVHSFDERNNKEVHYQIFFTQLLLNLLDWIELHHPLKFSLFENVAKKRTWGKVHAYQNSHAISKVRYDPVFSLCVNASLKRTSKYLIL